MTDRALYSGPSPTPIWKLWNTFGIKDAAMIGWWEQDVPVKTGRSDILATVYQRNGKSLIAIASWSKQAIPIRLQIDWQKLGINPSQAKVTAPELEGLQAAHSFSPNQDFAVPSGKGYLLIIE
jgi:hypothetical protein